LFTFHNLSNSDNTYVLLCAGQSSNKPIVDNVEPPSRDDRISLLLCVCGTLGDEASLEGGISSLVRHEGTGELEGFEAIGLNLAWLLHPSYFFAGHSNL